MSLIEATNIRKTYQAGEVTVDAIKDVSLSIESGSFVSFVGPSGSGKTTMLNMIGALDRPTSGTLRVADRDITDLDIREAARFRGDNIGFIFQDFNLLPVLTVYENVEYPLISVRKVEQSERKKRVEQLLEAVEMSDQAHKFPGQISGGQKQRVAVARALVTEPQLVLADEPTANLNSETAYRILELMKQMRDRFGTTFIFSTHDPKVMSIAERRLVLVDGRLEGEEGGHE